MRKGLVSFIIILCMLIPFTVGCQSNSADTVTPTQMQNQSAPPELSAQETEGNGVTTEPEATAADSIPETVPEPTVPSSTEPSIQETEPGVTEAPTEPPRETTPPVTEEPEQTEPKPTQPKPTEPAPTTDPPVTDPTEVLDLTALVQYGLNYAANTHGYEISPGVRDGYYPAYTCVFDTMEEGRAAVKGCVDDTTRALLARPGNHIVVEIDGVICRARIDITITPKDEGSYLVSVYYG